MSLDGEPPDEPSPPNPLRPLEGEPPGEPLPPPQPSPRVGRGLRLGQSLALHFTVRRSPSR